ncbi:MAG: phosphate butyryltransferase [Spirochaetales bacterium]|nr:phosphate butyryltransferase [Spirochaetales bacterium]
MSEFLKRIAIVGSDHVESILSMGEMCSQRQDVAFVLYGDSHRTQDILDTHDIDAAYWTIVHTNDDICSCDLASTDASNGYIDVLMKGSVRTSDFIKAILDKKKELIPAGALLSHVAKIELPWYHKPLYLTDAAISIKPDLDKKVSILENALNLARSSGIPIPKVALICPVEMVNPGIVSTTDAAQIVFLHNSTGRLGKAIVEGPFALDVALSKKAALVKHIQGDVPGDADILLLPDLDSANATLKAFILTPGVHYGGVVVGSKVPVVLTSRSDSADNRLRSMMLALS